MTPRTIERTLQNAAQGNKQAKQQITNLWQQQLSKIETKEYTRNEAFARMQKFVEGKKVQPYVVERGTYKYSEGNNAAYIVGEKVFMRSQPNTKAKILIKTNTNTTTYVTYLGEWIHPQTNERWTCVKNASGTIGWIFGKYVQLVPNMQFFNIVSQIKGKANISMKNDQSPKATAKRVPLGNSFKLISIENHLNKTLKKYSIYALIAWGIIFLVTFSMEWELDLAHIFKFICWSLVTVAIVVVAYHIIWKMIILPILKVIGLIFGGIIGLFFFGEYLKKDI